MHRNLKTDLIVTALDRSLVLHQQLRRQLLVELLLDTDKPVSDVIAVVNWIIMVSRQDHHRDQARLCARANLCAAAVGTETDGSIILSITDKWDCGDQADAGAGAGRRGASATARIHPARSRAPSPTRRSCLGR